MISCIVTYRLEKNYSFVPSKIKFWILNLTSPKIGRYLFGSKAHAPATAAKELDYFTAVTNNIRS